MSSHAVLKDQLNEMGFQATLIGKALTDLGEKATIDTAIEYIEKLMDGPPIDATTDDSKASEPKTDSEKVETLTEEERLKLMEKKKLEYEEKIKALRIANEAKAKEEELKREIKRREEGKGMGKMKEELEQLQRIKVAEDMRREKAEEKAAKDAVLAQIARDREEQRRAREQFSAPAQSPTPVVTPIASSAAKDGKCRLAISLLDGKQLVNEFDGRESLSAVRVFVMTHTSLETGITFVMPPQQPFTEEDMEKPLAALGLCPSSRIRVVKR